MGRRKWGHTARWAAWWIERNPTYLLSAALVAVGARLYLVSPRTRAGDVGLILLTLGVLQAYEWAVAGVLLLLHRWRRSPEDEPSLLLVSCLFWTGPMAATAEMTVHRPPLGLALGIGACVMALIELQAVRRAMGLRLSRVGQLIGCACVLLLAIAPPLARVPEEVDGSNELYLYLAWWLLAGIALMSAGLVRVHAPGRPESALPARAWGNLELEAAFVAIALGATSAHLAGMGFAFYGHARWFYASPLMVVLAAAGMDALATSGPRGWRLWAGCACLPAIAMALAHQPFDEHVPVSRLPGWLRDPMVAISLMAGLAWWFGYLRSGRSALLHAGSVALAWMAYRAVVPGLSDAGLVVHSMDVPGAPTRDSLVAALYAVAAYLVLTGVLRRSRAELLAAIAVHQAAVTLLVWDRMHGDAMIVSLVAGWSWLLGLHLTTARPGVRLAVWPVAFLTLVAWGYDLDNLLRPVARAHALGSVILLLAAGQLWSWTHYRTLAVGAGAGNIAFYAARWLAAGPDPLASAIVAGGFLLLAGGAVISWHKPALLSVNSLAIVPQPPERESTGPTD